MFKRILFLLCAAVILLTCLTQAAVEVSATPQTHPNTYVNTGDQKADLIGVALTQVGYYEGPGNDTKYGEYFNLNYHAWCGLFVSWCAAQAGIPDSVMKKTGIASPQSFGLKQHPAGYVPKSGDLFFTPSYGHVGIVYYVEGDHFYTLEGNTWDSSGIHGVYIRKKMIKDAVYATPNYQTANSCTYVKGNESKHPHKEFYKCNHCGDYYYTGKTGTSSSCQTCKELACKHSYGTYSKTNNSTHSRTCKLCGKKESAAHTWNGGTVTKAATCKATGTLVQNCTVCAAEKKSTIPKSQEHNYEEWLTVDEETHSRTCSICNKTEKESHKADEEWTTDSSNHWKLCSLCHVVIGEENHVFGEFCDSPCEICGIVRFEKHLLQQQWSTDENSHWYSCENCDAIEEFGEHVFDAICDETCNTCGYERKTEHSYSSEWISDGENHWIECQVCGAVKDLQKHTANSIDRKGAMQYCVVCAVGLTSATEHIHGFDNVYCDENYHYGTCSCGMEMEKEVHVWEMQSGICQICSAVYVEPKADYQELIPWAAGGAGLLVLGSTLLAFVLKKRKK